MKTWLTKSRTCPVCRLPCNDTAVCVYRLHLQSVTIHDNSCVTDTDLETVVKDSIVIAKDKEISDLKKQVSTFRQTIAKIRNYYEDTKILHRHIGIELGCGAGDRSAIDLTESPSTSSVLSSPVNPPAPIPPTTTSTAQSRPRMSLSRANSATTARAVPLNIASRARSKLDYDFYYY